MKKFMFLLAILMMATSASAQRSLEKAWKVQFETNLKNAVSHDDAAKAESVVNEYVTLKGNEKKDWLSAHTVSIKDIDVNSAMIGVYVNGQFSPLKQDGVRLSNVLFLRLQTLPAFNGAYAGQLFPMFLYENKATDGLDYEHDLLYSFDLDGDRVNDAFKYDEATKKHTHVFGTQTAVAQVNNVPQNGPAVTNAATTNQPAVNPVTATANVAPPPSQGPIVGYQLTPTGATVPLYGPVSNVPNNTNMLSGNANPGGNVSGVQQAPANSRTATLTNSKSITVAGDSTLLAQLSAQANGNNQNGQVANSQLPPGCYELPNGLIICKETVNGVETRTVYTPDGQVHSMDDNASMANIDMGKGRRILTSDGAPVGANIKNAHMLGMGDFAGTPGNRGYGRHGGVWTGQGNRGGGWVNALPIGVVSTGVVMGGGVGCGCPGLAPQPYFTCQNGNWIDPGTAYSGGGHYQGQFGAVGSSTLGMR